MSASFSSRSGGPVAFPTSVTGEPPTGTDNWRNHAACYGEDQELFFPQDQANCHAAKQICARCPVRAECLEYALKRNIQHGIWGGTSPKERRELRKERVRAWLASAPVSSARDTGTAPSAARTVGSAGPGRGRTPPLRNKRPRTLQGRPSRGSGATRTGQESTWRRSLG